MKNTAIFLAIVFLFSACTSTKDMSSAKSENRKLKKLAEQAEVKKAIEARKYIIKVDRLYVGGGRLDLVPTSNFVIVNGEIASISLAYMGRSFSRPISGINLNARTTNYRMQTNESKGTYKIQMSVTYGSDKFDVYLSIGSGGYSTISINNAYIQSVNYSGTLVPLTEPKTITPEKGNLI